MEQGSSKIGQLMHGLGMDLLLVLKIVAILFAAWFVERLIHLALRRGYAKAKAQGREEMTRYRFFRNAVRTLMVILALIAIVYVIPSLRSLAFTLFAGAGILAVVIGFAAQKALSDIISGVFIVAFKPFRVGDLIQAGEVGVFGQVEDINLRHTTILTFENRRLVIPNSILSEDRIVNSSIRDERTCEFIEFDLALHADINLAMALMQHRALLHPSRIVSPDVATSMENPEEPITVRLVKIHEGAITLRMYVWAKDPVDARRMHYDLNQAVLEDFLEQGIPFALPIRRSLQGDSTRPVVPAHGQAAQ
ncbi:MAG: mechanosensitive ion channel family protein [Flavobacteriales bacterium]|nr:mechanosensitive ion channel family protein [Flavobacteriales bacterium]MEB2340622.1 mechanosensitive ion channel family protein [Flavobacteriia bacterium]